MNKTCFIPVKEEKTEKKKKKKKGGGVEEKFTRGISRNT